MLDIPPDMFDRAYNSVANSVLWFVHHLLFDTPNQPRFGRGFRRDWAAYVAYNQAFADALAEEAAAGRGPRRGPRADPGLPPGLAPRMLRDKLARPATRIAHFSHTPWAPPDYYRLLPDEVGEAVLDGMLGADHVGFHAGRWADAFLDCCEAMLGAQVSRAGAARAGGSLPRARDRGGRAPARRGRRRAAGPGQADDVRAHGGGARRRPAAGS